MTSIFIQGCGWCWSILKWWVNNSIKILLEAARVSMEFQITYTRKAKPWQERTHGVGIMYRGVSPLLVTLVDQEEPGLRARVTVLLRCFCRLSQVSPRPLIFNISTGMTPWIASISVILLFSRSTMMYLGACGPLVTSDWGAQKVTVYAQVLPTLTKCKDFVQTQL